MRRTLIVLWLAGTVLPLWAAPSWACSCARLPRAEHVRLADVIFTGVASSVEHGRAVDVVELSATAVYKGPARSDWTVKTPSEGAACGFTFVEGRRYTVFAFHHRGALETHLCSATTSGEIDPDRFGLKGPVSVVPIGGAGEPAGPGSGWPPVLAGTGLALVTVAALVVLRRRARA